MNENKRPALSPFNTPLRCEYYRCNNVSKFRIGDPSGPQSVVYTLCEDHAKQVVIDGNTLFPELAGLDVKLQEAQAETKSAREELAELTEAKKEIETTLVRMMQVNNKHQEKIRELEQVIANMAIEAKKNAKPDNQEPKKEAPKAEPKRDSKKKG